MAAPAFFVPLAIAGAKIFFKFASKKAAQTFKSNYAKAGSITTKAPPKNATVTTTGSAKGKSVLKDLKSPGTAPSVRARNPNTTTLPKKPASNKGGKAAGAAATAAGVAAGSTATGKDADKPKKSSRSTSQGGRSRDQVIAENQKRLARKSAAQGGGSVLSRRKADKVALDDTKIDLKKDRVSKPTPPPARPKKKAKSVPTPTPKPKMYTAINPRTGKPDFDAPKVTAAERLRQEDKFKKREDALKKVRSAAKENMDKRKKKKMNKGGAALKSVPAGNPGLKKLPTAVRNRMGFMRKGGVAKKK
tara:strand:+ start:31 stop:942 length:912 start_codon:yes stop_codon:yes gene_type:complete